jgi:hypothetical protein
MTFAPVVTLRYRMFNMRVFGSAGVGEHCPRFTSRVWAAKLGETKRSPNHRPLQLTCQLLGELASD